MNEKIKQLALQAKLYDYVSVAEVMSVTYSDLEKFAELIIRECVDIANNVHMCRDGKVIAEDIKQHFGVKE